MGTDDFLACLKTIDEHFRAAAGSFWHGLDRMTFRMLVDTLKSQDAMAVREACVQLGKEKRPQAIPPLYLLSVAHPSDFVRGEAKKALDQIIPDGEIKQITDGKDIKGSVQCLIDKFGHYRS